MSQSLVDCQITDRGIAIASDDLPRQRLGEVGTVHHPRLGARQTWSCHVPRWRLPPGPQAVIDLQRLSAGCGRVTGAGLHGDALQQIGGNKGAGHDASLTVASHGWHKNAAHSGHCDGLMNFHCDCLQHAHRQVTFGLADHRGRILSRVLDGMPSHVSG